MNDWTFDSISDPAQEEENLKREIENSLIDISYDELRGMHARATYYLCSPHATRSERRLAKSLIRAVNWITREVDELELKRGTYEKNQTLRSR